jgi:N-acetylmuramoyl-L-alanine amidase
MNRMLRSLSAFYLPMLFIVTFLGRSDLSCAVYQTSTFLQPETTLLIIDAGHGGEDGGAVSVNGVHESELNLAIAKKLDSLATFFGVRTLMLRDSNVSLHSEEADGVRERKASDLQNRVTIVNSYPNATLVSIHQNTFPGAASHGAQVFYTGEGEGMLLALHAQTMLVKYLDPFNHRQAAKTPHTVYLMTHVTCPAILLECGFLSNAEEAKKLESETYQKKLAVVLSAAYLTREV